MRRRSTLGRWVALALVGAFMIVLPAGGAASKAKRLIGAEKLTHRSQAVALSYWLANPDAAPAQLQGRLQTLREMADAGIRARRTDSRARAGADVFNNDIFGLPQNEESVTACKNRPNVVLSGTNDYRFIVDLILGEDAKSITGWHFSNTGGRTLTNEGRLPPVPSGEIAGVDLDSGGDPVKVAGTGCESLYAASLAYDLDDPDDLEADETGDTNNGIALYRSTPGILASCDTASDPKNPDCWPDRRLVAEAPNVPPGTLQFHFLDKEWFDVGRSGAAGKVVWVVYADFAVDLEAPEGFTSAEIFAVRCDAALVDCTEPIPISVDDGDVQFADVTIAPDGRVYVTWSEIVGELSSDPEFPVQTFIHKLRIAEPGSTTFGPERTVFVEERAIPFGGFMHANDWRVATYPKSDVAMVRGNPRIFVVWEACRFRPLDSICEEAEIKLAWSDDDGASWSGPIVLSRGGDNYFPSIVSNDAARPTLAFTWFSNRRDRAFHNRQDVQFMSMDPARVEVRGFRRLTTAMNESEADPILGGFFIGDYIEVAAAGKNAWVAYNANYLQKRLLGPFGVEGIPVPQQDNYLRRVSLP